MRRIIPSLRCTLRCTLLCNDHSTTLAILQPGPNNHSALTPHSQLSLKTRSIHTNPYTFSSLSPPHLATMISLSLFTSSSFALFQALGGLGLGTAITGLTAFRSFSASRTSCVQ